jgi:heat shock protein HslJ
VGRKLHLYATATGVVVRGEAGAVPPAARVDVINTATAETASTTAAADGSFEVELAGAATDEIRVYVGSGQESWRTRLTSSGASTLETGLEGRSYLLTSSPGYTPIAGSRLQLGFSPGEFSFNAGCNSYSGPYSVCDGKLCVAELGSTTIGCDAARQTQDEWFVSFFSAEPQLDIAGAALTLQGAGATLELLDQELADPDRPLTGRVWSIDTFIQGATASSFPMLTAPPTLEFGNDGTLTVFDGCNGGSANYTRDGQRLTLSSLGFTEVACSGTRATEERVHAVIAEGELIVEIDAKRLTLTHGDSGLGAKTD